MKNQIKDKAPEAFKGYLEYKKGVFKDGAISTKGKELIAIAVAHAIQCQFCITHHATEGRKLGLEEDEIAEAIMVGAYLRTGASLAYSHYAYEAIDEEKEE